MPRTNLFFAWILVGMACPFAAAEFGREGTVKARVAHDSAAELLERGGTLVADYGAFAVVEVPEAALSAEIRAEVLAHENVIALRSGPIDTTRQAARQLRRVKGAFTGNSLHMVQFAGPVRPAWHDDLARTGVRIVTYIPSNAYLLYGDAAQIAAVQRLAGRAGHIQWDAEYQPHHKYAPRAPADTPPGAIEPVDADLCAVQLVDDPPANNDTLQMLDGLRSGPVRRAWRLLGYYNVVVSIPAGKLADLAARPDVVSIQPYALPEPCDERQNQIVAGNLTGSAPTAPGYLAWLASWGFTQAQFDASGFVVDVSDSGIDNATTSPNHFGLYVNGAIPGVSRIMYNRLEGTPNSNSTLKGCNGHGTINAHIIAGFCDLTGFPHQDAGGYRYGLGVAPFVRVGSSVIFDPSTFTFPNFANLQSKAYQDNARISSNSWGANVGGAYNADAQAYDALVRDAQPAGSTFAAPGNQEMVVVCSNGNYGPALTTVGSPASAKNVISVGAAENVHPFGGMDNCGLSDTEADSANDIIWFSSRGPTADGRKKPDLVAPGTHVTGGAPQANAPGPTGTADACYTGSSICGGVAPSRYFPNGQQFYTASSGTSHSCPAVAGGAALIRQLFLNRGMPAPSPAMTKALLINSARYLTGVGGNNTLWCTSQGMGELNLSEAFARGVTPTVFRDQEALDLFTATGQQRVFPVNVADPSKPVRVTLAWTDAPGPTSGAAYRNNLDLAVTIGANTYKGNVFAGALSATGGTADFQNNVESVLLPAGVTGGLAVTVTAANINSDGVPNAGGALDQDFALVIYNAVPAFVAAAGMQIIAESCLPANAAVDPGETVTLEFALQNVSASDVSSVVATLLPCGGVTAPGAPQYYGTLPTGGPGVSRPFTFTAAGACNAPITATLQLADGGTPLEQVQFVITLGRLAVLLAENFDALTPPALPAGWTVGISGGTTPWATTATLSDTPPGAVFAPAPMGVSDNRLESPGIPVTSVNARLSFRHRYDFESTYDGGALEIAIGAGPFIDILPAGGAFTAGGYTQTINTCCSNPLGGRPAWSGHSQGFITTTVNLPPAAAGQNIRLRWRAGTDISIAGGGWYVDSVLVSEPQCCTCIPLPAPANLQAEPAAICPNGGSILSATPGSGGDTIDWFTTADCTGPPLLSGASVAVSPASTTTYHAQTRHSATQCISPCSGPLTVTVDPCVRSITAWRSVRTHMGAGPLAIALNPAASGNGVTGPAAESRAGGLERVEVDFSGSMTLIGPAHVQVLVRRTVNGVMNPPSPDPPASVAMLDTDTLAIDFSPGQLPGEACYSIKLTPGVFAETLVGDTDVSVRGLHGDATMSGDVTLSDAILIRARMGIAAAEGPQLDVNLSGQIGMDDVVAAKSRVSLPPRRALCP